MTPKTIRCLTVTLALASWSTAALAQSSGVNVVAGNNTPGGTVAGDGVSMGNSVSSNSSVSTQDKNFVNAATQSGLIEVQEGQLASQKGDKAVQAFGQRMVTDHTTANDQLKSAAQGLGLTPPASPSAAQQAQYAKLQDLSGTAFDKAYLKDQRMAHEKAIKLFKKEASSGKSSVLKSFASQTLPTLHDHLKMIKQTQS
jgi:putative membrane protein